MIHEDMGSNRHYDLCALRSLEDAGNKRIVNLFEAGLIQKEDRAASPWLSAKSFFDDGVSNTAEYGLSEVQLIKVASNLVFASTPEPAL